jgi:5'-3' exonuclease
MVPMMDVVAFAPAGSLLLCLQETEDELWGELTDIQGRLEDEDIARALAEAPLIFVVTSNPGYESVHVETLTSWDQELQDLLVQQAQVRVGFFRTVERHQ